MIFLLALLLSAPLPNAIVTVAPGGTATTDALGRYAVQVDTPWSGTVTASAPGCAFDPVSLPAPVTMDTTIPPIPCIDVQAPAVRITWPTSSTIQRTTVTLQCQATDNVAVARVVWMLDSTTLGTINVPPFSLVWNTSKVKPGQHILKATAWDAAGNQATASVRVRVQ